MKFDIVIANPPYGKIGNTITKNIIEHVDYKCFVNLLPSSDYRRYNKGFKLYQFVDINSMRTVQGGFKDAAVTTMVCRVNKDRALYISEAEFEIENYGDKSLKKYFYENRNRKHYATENVSLGMMIKDYEDIEVKKSIYIGARDPKSNHLPYSMDSITTRYNMNKLTKEQFLSESSKSMISYGRVGYCYIIAFKTEKEKENIVNFIYSKDGFRFISKLFTALNVDSAISVSKWFPKVSWQKPQTVESILLDYNYTPAEIAEIIDDLKNYRFMDDR